MKNNAIIRIVAWSIVILVLTGVLLAGIGLGSFFNLRISNNPAESAVPTPLTEPTLANHQPGIGTVTQTTNIRKTPSATSEVVSWAQPGIPLTITVVENVNGRAWGYIQAPVQGWMIMDYFQPEEGTAVTDPTVATVPSANPSGTSPSETAAPAQAGGHGYSCPADQVHSISIDWHAGSIRILPSQDNRIHVHEEGRDTENLPMELKTKDGKLSIDFCEETLWNGLGLNSTKTKDLTVQVPLDWVCNDLEIDTASSPLEIQGLTAQEVEIDAASGTSQFTGCTIDTLEIDTASGDVIYSGSLNILEMDAASASFRGLLSNTPHHLKMDSASGAMELTLPEDTGFTVKIDAMKGKFQSDFQTTKQNNAYVYGNGACRIDMNTMSGSVQISKATP